MLDRRLGPLVFVAVGLFLVLNPVYLFPDGVPVERTYTLEADRPADLASVVRYTDESRTDRVVECASGAGPYEDRSCVFESMVGPDGRLEIRNRSVLHRPGYEPELRSLYSYVYIHDHGFYQPAERVDDRTVTLTLDPVPVRAVAANLSLPADRAPDAVREALDGGRVTTTTRTPPDDEQTCVEDLRAYVGTVGCLVQHNGTHYQVVADVSTELAVPPVLLELARLGGVLGGLGLLALGVLRQRALVDAGA